MHRNRTFASLVLLAGIAAAAPASARAQLVQSNPAADAKISAPRSIRLTFSEKIVPAGSGFQISMGDGMTISAVTKLSDDGKTLMATPTSPFMAGTYTLAWHAAAAAGGDRTEGSYSFTVK